MWTSSCCMAATSMVPVTARPRGVVLKYSCPAVEMWKAPALEGGDALGDQLRAALDQPRLLGAVRQGLARDRLRSRPRPAGRDARCRRTGSSRWRASMRGRRSCRALRRTRCRPARRRGGSAGCWALDWSLGVGWATSCGQPFPAGSRSPGRPKGYIRTGSAQCAVAWPPTALGVRRPSRSVRAGCGSKIERLECQLPKGSSTRDLASTRRDGCVPAARTTHRLDRPALPDPVSFPDD